MSDPTEPPDPTATATVPSADESAESDAQVRPGDRLGRYVLLSVLGQGGMSVVYLAYDPELDRKVALKLMKAGLIGTLGRSRLQREAQALARLSHPNVVPVYDVGSVKGGSGDQAFVAMEHVEGVTLKRWLKQPRSWREIVQVMRDAGRGLAAAHEAGLVHRDFKPDNVLIGNDGRVRVLDFGLARTVEDLSSSNPSERTPAPSPPSPPSRDFSDDSSESSSSTSSRRLYEQVTRADQIIGTPAYMAPEQLLNGATDERADQFSFCVTFYEALYKVKPFDHSDTASGSKLVTIADKKSKKHRARPTAAPPPKNAGVPRHLERLVMRGLSVDPVDRWPSMHALLAELQKDPAQRRRRWLLASGALLVVALGVVGASSLRNRERALCRGGALEVARVWGPGMRDAVKHAFLQLGLPYADAAASTFTRALDDYTAEWARMHQQACEATRIHREQSEEVLDLRMACLSDRLKEVSALAEAMSHPDQDAVQEASRAAQTLTPVAECADIAALKGAQPRPRDPQKRAQVESLTKRLAEMQARDAVGKSTEAAQLGEQLAKDAAATGWLPLLAEVHLWRGRAAADLGDENKSIPAYREAFAVSLASRNDRVLRQSAVRLAQEYIYKNDISEYRYWEEVAQAAIDRTGPDPRLESFLQHTHCIALWQSGRVNERLDCLKKHAAKVERLQPLTEWELTTLGLAAGDAGQLDESIEWLKRGVDYSTRENGYTHPRTIEMRTYLCKGWLDYGDYDQAETECRGALKTANEVAAEDKTLVGRIKLYLGIVSREKKHYDEAKRLFDDARRLYRPESEVLSEQAELASLTGDHATALAFFQKTLAEDEKELSPDHANLVTDLLDLGEAELRHGDTKSARTVLARAYKIVSNADVSPFLLADVSFAYARALWASDPAERGQALVLAERARDGYRKGPRTEKFLDGEREIDRFLKDPAHAR